MQGDALPLAHLSHLSRVVADPETSAAFYRNVLGFREIRRPSSFDFDGRWASFSVPKIPVSVLKDDLMIITRASAETTFTPFDIHLSIELDRWPAQRGSVDVLV